MEHIRYKKETTEVVTFQGKEITLENLSPVFTLSRKRQKRRELEQQLYEVFASMPTNGRVSWGIRFPKPSLICGLLAGIIKKQLPFFKKRSDNMNNRIDAIYARQSVDKKDSISIKARLSFANTN